MQPNQEPGYFEIIDLRSARVRTRPLEALAICSTETLGVTVARLTMAYGQVLVRPSTQSAFEAWDRKAGPFPLI